MSAACARRCQISNAIDTRYAGQAIGVGSSEIIGGIQDLGFRIGPVNFQNKISILRSTRCDFLLGLDILKRFKCEINIADRVLKLSVRGNEIRIPMVSDNSNTQSNDMQRYMPSAMISAEEVATSPSAASSPSFASAATRRGANAKSRAASYLAGLCGGSSTSTSGNRDRDLHERLSSNRYRFDEGDTYEDDGEDYEEDAYPDGDMSNISMEGV
eukprot:CAMPEP_0174983760 /NCGR_PEP_ID=MMETSP0004_2-20121128/17335_1 /TAXON_ID=420556 /ORGANISM="Ochromonas sp., Strain CCMP1393" /LENGTH=213 /DNA_ID=CAMNT_0016236073 /DNA_START=164 /DNA_END=805 /DNA_ORIENTATION=+